MQRKTDVRVTVSRLARTFAIADTSLRFRVASVTALFLHLAVASNSRFQNKRGRWFHVHLSPVWGEAGRARTCARAWPRKFEGWQERQDVKRVWKQTVNPPMDPLQRKLIRILPLVSTQDYERLDGRYMVARRHHDSRFHKQTEGVWLSSQSWLGQAGLLLTFRWNFAISIRRTNWGIDYTKWWLCALEVLEPKWENGISMKYYSARGCYCFGLCVTSEERKTRKSVFTRRCRRRSCGAKGHPWSRSYFTSPVCILDTQMLRR